MKLNIICSAFFVYTYIKNFNGRVNNIKLCTIRFQRYVINYIVHNLIPSAELSQLLSQSFNI